MSYVITGRASDDLSSEIHVDVDPTDLETKATFNASYVTNCMEIK